MYAIVKTGGKQYRVEQGQSLLVERLPVDGGGTVTLEPLLFVDGSQVVDAGPELAKVTVQARVVGHERGPKLRVVKFKPKRGYKRRNGHRQELTRIEVTEITAGSAGAKGGSAKTSQASKRRAAAAPADTPAPPASEPDAPAAPSPGDAPAADAPAAASAGDAPAPEAPTPSPAPEAPTPNSTEAENGS